MESQGEYQIAAPQAERHWFHQMEGYLQWKVIAPDYNNPFRQPVPDHVLIELLKHRSALRRVCSLRLLCEGFELMAFDNLEAPAVLTDHPCILALGVHRILDYINASEAQRVIEEQLDRIARGISELLDERAINPSDEQLFQAGEKALTIAQMRELREARKSRYKTAAGGVRVRYVNSSSSYFAGLAF
ncbi:MAG: hypothetical protein K1X79_07300 [Oligoflexia bacterium]|nr:hypothetical protein [Oligoflexia bacterium]